MEGFPNRISDFVMGRAVVRALWKWCQRKIEMSYSLQSRNVLFSIAHFPSHGRLIVPAG
jgi:hypothetical protein